MSESIGPTWPSCLTPAPSALTANDVSWLSGGTTKYYLPMGSYYFVYSAATILGISLTTPAEMGLQVNFNSDFTTGTLTGKNGAFVTEQCTPSPPEGTSGNCSTVAATNLDTANEYYGNSLYWMVYENEDAGVVVDVCCTADGSIGDWKVLSKYPSIGWDIRVEIYKKIWPLFGGFGNYRQMMKAEDKRLGCSDDKNSDKHH